MTAVVNKPASAASGPASTPGRPASTTGRPASTSMVVAAFAIVYIVWGSTYFFISLAVKHIPPMLVGAFRFLIAGTLMLLWCMATGKKVFVWKDIRPAIVSGLLLLLVSNGSLIWSEQYVTSSLAAILLASGPIWFVILDKRMWATNFRSRETIIGLVVGFAGVVLLFGEKLWQAFFGAVQLAGGGSGHNMEVIALVVLVLGSISWAAGSLYSKYKSTGASNSVNVGWQMLVAGLAFLPASWISGEMSQFHWQDVTMSSWLSVFYLVTMGSLAGYSAFVWLLQVRSATQVSTHAYVNPVVAVLLGTLFAGDHMSMIQLLGLTIILVSVLLINLAKYRARSAATATNSATTSTARTTTSSSAAAPAASTTAPANSATTSTAPTVPAAGAGKVSREGASEERAIKDPKVRGREQTA